MVKAVDSLLPGALKRGLGRTKFIAREAKGRARRTKFVARYAKARARRLEKRSIVADDAIGMPSRLAAHIVDYPIEMLRTDGA